MGAVDTTYTFTATDTITSTKMNNIIDQTTITTDAIIGTTLDIASGKLKVRSQGITSNEMGNNSIVTAAITDANVTPSKLSQPLTARTIVASTSGTLIDFIDIPNWAKKITVMFNGVSTNGISQIQVQLGSGSILSSGYAGSAAWIIQSGGTGIVAASSNSSGFRFDNFAGASNVRHGIATIALIGSNSWIFSSTTGLSDSQAVGFGAGSVSLSGVLDRIRITTVNATDIFDNGSINIMYE